MSITRRDVKTLRTMLCVTIAAAAMGLVAGEAAAQKWPEKPVRIVTPFAPGG
ncbi:MAG: hypothetical protein JWO70_1380, partial [Betaproteobacteria bacterium]|nr:hypothetical protein [Betaproteobacteria bacterium]